jgi:transcriptional regulator with PAS, ATPase and Fis domain
MSFPKPDIIGNSRAMQKVIEITQKVSNVDLNVLITGESGVGKELVARSLHYYSPQKESPFVKVNSAALPSELMESELFGYEKGAFTGADRSKMGKFELAGRGSIFLDEIGEIPLFMQSKLLQVLQDRKFHRIGGQGEVQVSARVITATNQNLDAEIAAGNFRDDLYYRLTTIAIHIPPLRDRKEDIQPLVEYFIKKLHEEHEMPRVKMTSRLMDLFYRYHWPGNVRELENYLNRLSVLSNFRELEDKLRRSIESHSPQSAPAESEETRSEEDELTARLHNNSFPSLKEVRDQAVRRVEKMVIEQVLEETHWNRKEAAKILKISYRALLYKMKDMNIKPTYR